MGPDELLSKVAGVLREREASGLAHPRWEKLAHGDPEEEAARKQMVRSAADERLMEVFRPFDKKFGDDLSRQILQQLGDTTSPSGPRPVDVETPDVQDTKGPDTKAPKRVIEPAASADRQPPRLAKPAWWQRRFVIGFATSAALAALAVVVLLPATDSPLPAYEMAFVGGDRTWRSAAPAEPRAVPELKQGSQLEWTLRPTHAVAGEVAAQAFLISGETVQAWEAPFEISEQGAVRVHGTVAELGLAAGEWTLALAVGRPNDLPREPHEILNLTQRDANVRLFTQRIRVTDEE